jgi:hypothetical protein
MNRISQLFVITFVSLWSVLTWASNPVCGSGVVNNPNVDAAASLLNCIQSASAAKASIVELLPGRYYINGSLDLGSISNIRIRTLNLSSGPACLDAGASACAILTATPTNLGPTILRSTNATGLILDHIAIDGNIAPRRARYNNSSWALDNNNTRRSATNSFMHGCDNCQFLGFASVRAAWGTGMEFYGSNAIFTSVYFAENGWGATSSDGNWSDGLTLLSAPNVRVTDSKFIDNSDVDLVIGGASGGVISANQFTNRYNFAFAALMFDNFNGSQPGTFVNTSITNNSINCNMGMCGIGMGFGPHLWYPSASINGIGAQATGNNISGAKQGILTAGAYGFTITQNNVYTNGAYAANNYVGFTANPISVSTGDAVSVYGNNYGVYANLLAGATPNALLPMVVHMAGVSYTIAVDYRNILGRDPDISGGQYYTQVLATGESNSSIMQIMATSNECYNLLNAMYLKYLGRSIDPSGWTTYSAALANGRTTQDKIRVILQLSPEALSNPYRYY